MFSGKLTRCSDGINKSLRVDNPKKLGEAILNRGSAWNAGGAFPALFKGLANIKGDSCNRVGETLAMYWNAKCPNTCRPKRAW